MCTATPNCLLVSAWRQVGANTMPFVALNNTKPLCDFTLEQNVFPWIWRNFGQISGTVSRICARKRWFLIQHIICTFQGCVQTNVLLIWCRNGKIWAKRMIAFFNGIISKIYTRRSAVYNLKLDVKEILIAINLWWNYWPKLASSQLC